MNNRRTKNEEKQKQIIRKKERKRKKVEKFKTILAAEKCSKVQAAFEPKIVAEDS